MEANAGHTARWANRLHGAGHMETTTKKSPGLSMDWLNKTLKNKQNTKQHTSQMTTGKRQPNQREEFTTKAANSARTSRTRTHTLAIPQLCETCVRTKGRADNHKRQTSKRPVVQVDITYIKSINEKDNTPILTAVDVETGMCMATLVRDRTQHFEVNCLQSFLMDTGRAQATLANTVLQSDQEQFLINLLKATALRLGGNITVRQAPAYSSQSQGSVERLHRTLVGQIRTLRAQLQKQISHWCLGWSGMRHTSSTGTKYTTMATPASLRRWNREHKTPLCIFGETVQYMIPTTKALPKLEQRFFKGIWLGKDTATNEHIIGTTNKVQEQ